MNLHAIRDSPSPELAKALATFEAGFAYPLGPGRSFTISHGDDYPRFFRAMGPATCFIAERENDVLGAMGVAIRTLRLPDAGVCQAAYIGDLKVNPGARGTLVFLRLARAADAWARPQVTAAYGIVMDGTRISPGSYTGRVGIPEFLVIGKVCVLRFDTKVDFDRGQVQITSAECGEKCYRALSIGRYMTADGTPEVRSEMGPLWLVHGDGAACGRLEDTRRAKRLIDRDGIEMMSAHLAYFAWRTAGAAAELIHAARSEAAKRGMPALFVAVADVDLMQLESALGDIDKIVAPATVYGAGLPKGHAWNINSSEI